MNYESRKLNEDINHRRPEPSRRVLNCFHEAKHPAAFHCDVRFSSTLSRIGFQSGTQVDRVEFVFPHEGTIVTNRQYAAEMAAIRTVSPRRAVCGQFY